MYNKYTIEIYKDGEQLKADIIQNKAPVGTIWRPRNKTTTRNDYAELFESIYGVVYGSEQKSIKASQSRSESLAEHLAKSISGQEK